MNPDQQDQIFTRTTNGAVAYSEEYSTSDNQKKLVYINDKLVSKDDFPVVKQNLESLLTKESKDSHSKVLATVLIFNFRDIEFGKGLRDPFIEGLKLLKDLGYSDLIKDLLPYIPRYGYFKDYCRLYLEFKEDEVLKENLCKSFIWHLKKEKESGVQSNAAKYAPRLQKKYNQFGFEISNMLFPTSVQKQKDYRLFLREIQSGYKFKVVEELMTKNNWEQIKPEEVPSLCLKRNKKAFLNKKELKGQDRIQCALNFSNHIQKGLKGEAKVNAKRLFAHELVKEGYTLQMKKYQQDENPTENLEDDLGLLELQWRDLISSVSKGGELLKKSVVMVDVSGSMNAVADKNTTCLDVALGLGMVISEVSGRKKVLTFSQNPVWVELGEEPDFKSKIEKMKNAQWAMNTNLLEALKVIIESADNEEQIPECLFILSDMQFDSACQQHEQNTVDAQVNQLLLKKGFSNAKQPLIIFWNLSSSFNNMPFDSHQNKVINLSGFNQALLKTIQSAKSIDEIKKLSPYTFLKFQLCKPRYNVVFKQACKHFGIPVEKFEDEDWKIEGEEEEIIYDEFENLHFDSNDSEDHSDLEIEKKIKKQ